MNFALKKDKWSFPQVTSHGFSMMCKFKATDAKLSYHLHSPGNQQHNK